MWKTENIEYLQGAELDGWERFTVHCYTLHVCIV